MYLFSTIFCTFFFTSFLFFEGTFSSPYIKGKTKQNSCIINIYNCTRKRRVGGGGEGGVDELWFTGPFQRYHTLCTHIDSIWITVEPLFTGHPLDRGKCPVNRGVL